MVNVEDELGKWKLTNVIYCPGGTQPCRKVAGGHVGANGVLLVPDKQNGGQLLMVDDWPGAYLAVYKVNSDHSLTKLEEIPLGSPIDNLSYDPVADAFLAATFPSIKGFLHHYLHPWTNKFAPISVTRIKRLPDENGKTKHEAKIVMYTDKLTGSISTVLSDSDYDVTVIGGIKNRGLTICPRAMAKDVSADGAIPNDPSNRLLFVGGRHSGVVSRKYL